MPSPVYVCNSVPVLLKVCTVPACFSLSICVPDCVCLSFLCLYVSVVVLSEPVNAFHCLSVPKSVSVYLCQAVSVYLCLSVSVLYIFVNCFHSRFV